MRRCKGMGKLVFGMMQSLDGYVAGVAGGPGSDGYVTGLATGLELPPPGDSLNRHFNDHVRGLAGLLCGRRMYEVMRYWDEDQPEWDVVEHDFAALLRGARGRGRWSSTTSRRCGGRSRNGSCHARSSRLAPTRRSWRAMSKRSCAG